MSGPVPTRERPVVHKFGGAALADAASIRHAATIIADEAARGLVLIVASAAYGVTDALLALASRAAAGDPAGARVAGEELRTRHHTILAQLALVDPAAQTAVAAAIDRAFDELPALIAAVDVEGDTARDALVARGERMSAQLLTAALVDVGLAAEYLDATRVVQTDGRAGGATPDRERTAAAAAQALTPLLAGGAIPVLPGFIGQAPDGRVVTLGRGGSDLTATLVARAVDAAAVVLWKDVPGFLTASPRVVPNARVLPALHVREAAELAYHGAHVLHPRALTALSDGTPLFIRPLADPAARGTEIVAHPTTERGTGRESSSPVKALSAIADQALVTILGTGMLGVPGIAARAFGALERAGISVSLISQASSEYSICLGIPAVAATAAGEALREAFAAELARRDVERIDVREGVGTIAVVGLGMAGAPGVAARLFGALGDARINVVAIAQGASELNISVVLAAADVPAAQRAIHAAFQLDKIGGGRAEPVTHADVVLLGFGKIGRELIAQIAAGEGTASVPGSDVRAVRAVAVIDSSGYVFDPDGLAPRRLAALARAKQGGGAVANAPGGVRASADAALDAIGRHALSRPVLVDVTAGDTGPVLAAAVTYGMDVVLANKRPLAGARQPAAALLESAAAGGRRVLHEATVGAGLPIIDTLHKLLDSGDQILRIEGCPSGTLGFLFGELGRGARFSEALARAMALGYTEPDPRDDLSGMDVARKGVILGRLLGYTGELDDVRVVSLVPSTMRTLSLDAFLAAVPRALDAPWARRVAAARARGRVLRYRAAVSRRGVRVGVVAVDNAHALASLSGTDNQFTFTTRRYRTNPLVITGPGAGVAVTAAGVLNDVMKLAAGR